MPYHVYKDNVNQYRWRFKAANNKIIADSGEAYHNKADCLAGIKIMKGSANEQVVDPTA